MATETFAIFLIFAMVTVSSAQYAAWPATSYSPFLQALLAPLQHPVAPVHIATPVARYVAPAPVIPGLFAANMVPKVVPHGPPRVVSYSPALTIFG
ncbi:hypothetical protein QR680_006880 [Steinernema hermaphroditum]|uniref:Uncharacterized protein n=1 Tax=Steinernema hermaphroditum TaxID=289476 RepID=A0AA39HZ72_9BILA|nr:hypothetical protein QR680_006880 [Steinernema hermaphroditum]